MLIFNSSTHQFMSTTFHQCLMNPMCCLHFHHATCHFLPFEDFVHLENGCWPSFFDGWNFPCIYFHTINQQSLILKNNPTSNSILYDSNIYWNVPFEKYCFDPIFMDYSKQYFFSKF
jgi:hypothetical protein